MNQSYQAIQMKCYVNVNEGQISTKGSLTCLTNLAMLYDKHCIHSSASLKIEIVEVIPVIFSAKRC